MKRKIIFIVILVMTFFAITMSFLLKSKDNYNSLVISEEKWNEIRTKKREDNNLKILKMIFNDYPLIIDDNNSMIYYSILDLSNKYNPTISFESNKNDTKVAISQNINDETIKMNKKIELMVYNDSEYHMYHLNITNLPLINIEYKNNLSRAKDADIMIFDNHKDAIQNFVRTMANITVTEEKDYIVSLRQNSIGNNKRENNISLFGMRRENDFILTKYNDLTIDNRNIVLLFINNEIQGKYLFDYREKRGLNDE